MSASLVGSEMCIRDRVRGGYRPPDPPARAASPGGLLLPRTPPEALFGAVSYTHLTLPTICSV
eukprot:478772-Alexandrium_andersonii.AAC.1